ncbi:hypothetical protein [Paenibacillus sp. Leaf72]|uniref:hypothetical protein n=1 Tax=Paenibacillus sp. Leaf72 TaxID=1736234 RepID=UPI0006FD8B31|nr:hypothetical protein [Paenibacillus sp. Leaf72]KQN96798.1 hypothetical protein ASF12_22255 [Paenibacillus sp. Leaf72]
MGLNPVLSGNIQNLMDSMPLDVCKNIKDCTDKWLQGEVAYGYPHPVQACTNFQAIHDRQPFLTTQQALNLVLLKNQLNAV